MARLNFDLTKEYIYIEMTANKKRNFPIHHIVYIVDNIVCNVVM